MCGRKDDGLAVQSAGESGVSPAGLDGRHKQAPLIKADVTASSEWQLFLRDSLQLRRQGAPPPLSGDGHEGNAA